MFFSREIESRNGFTLLEVLVTIVVVGIAATAALNVFTSTVVRSANPLIQQQAVAIAEAYMEEIMLHRFCQADFPELPDPPPPPPNLSLPDCDPFETPGGGSEAGETRSTFNDVQDYKGLVDNGARGQNGVQIAGLEQYTVSVNVSAAALGSITQASGNAMRVDVSVNHPAIDPILLSGFRVKH